MKQKRPLILLVNDDGINAPGLKALWKAVAPLGDTYIAAPAFDQSGMGLAITLRAPLLIEEVRWEDDRPAWKINGTPADCVRLAISVLLDRKPDLIVSGINRGGNHGRVMFYSGTIGGALEGTLRGIPGIAFSYDEFVNPAYESAEPVISEIVKHVFDEPLPVGTFLNVTFPKGGFKGVRMARQGMGYWQENPDKRVHPEGQSYFWHGGKWEGEEEHLDSDVTLLKEGYVTAVPIHVHELTHHQLLEQRRKGFESLFQK